MSKRRELTTKLALAMIRFYQGSTFFHQFLGGIFFLSDRSCRFEPTCSKYTYEAIEKYGLWHGTWTGFKRIIRCHPWSKGGWDPLK